MVLSDHMVANGNKYVKCYFNRPRYKCYIIISRIVKHIATLIFPFAHKVKTFLFLFSLPPVHKKAWRSTNVDNGQLLCRPVSRPSSPIKFRGRKFKKKKGVTRF